MTIYEALGLMAISVIAGSIVGTLVCEAVKSVWAWHKESKQ